MSLLRDRPRQPAAKLIGLVDPRLPPLLDEAADLLDDIVGNAYAAERLVDASKAAVVSMSPMTHAPDFSSRLTADPRLVRAAVVYDFIPRRFPERYLPMASSRLGYAHAMRWLTHHDLFMPISQSVSADLVDAFGIPQNRIFVTGCPLADFLLRPREGREHAAHVLVVGGGDPRKNPEVVIRAHARATAMQSGNGIPLLIGGNYSVGDGDRFRQLAIESGGRAELVRTSGHVSNDDLYAMYRDALAVVTPSYDEGFSLPVIEGMAAGALCLASNIPVHRELITDASALFGPDDSASLSEMLDRATTDATWRKVVIKRQDAVWPHFRSYDVAARFWEPIFAALDRPSAPAINRHRRPRIAMLSPVPPDRSGVADYTAAICRGFGDTVELDVFTETRQPHLSEGSSARLRPMTALPHLRAGYDRVISVIGNSAFHLRVFDYLMNYGGACIAHDARMLGFYAILLGRPRAMQVASKELGRIVDEQELNAWLADERELKALLLGEIAMASSPMIVHSPVTAELCDQRYGITPDYLPFCIQRSWSKDEVSATARLHARTRTGVSSDEVLISTFGFVHSSKAPEECIWVLDILRRWGIPARLHFVGDLKGMPDSGAGLRELAQRLGVGDYIRLWGDFVSEQDYQDHLLGSDLAIQLRTHGLGSVSGALSDCGAAGLATVANLGLMRSAGLPESYGRVVPDALSPLIIAENLASLWEESAFSGTAARRAEDRVGYVTDRSPAAYARGLLQCLELDAPSAFFSRGAA